MEISVKSAIGFKLVYTFCLHHLSQLSPAEEGHAPSPCRLHPGSLLQGREHPTPCTS